MQGNPWWYSNDNIFYAAGYGLPNCTCYSYGRYAEARGDWADLPSGNGGDWYDAAQIYREFVERSAQYCPEYGEHGRKGVPEWLLETDCWFNTRVLDDGDFAEDVIAQAKVLGVNPAIHLYYWHQIPFDNDYPHYFPMRENVLPGLKKLHEAGIKVMPYINGRLWDTRDRGTEDYEFSSVAKPWTTKDMKGEPITEQYSSKESDGSKVTLAVMCPSATLWQDRVASIVERLFETGFDGVYIDQIAAAEAKPCTDKRHKHPAGGGEWWCRAYNTMLERIAANKPADRALTTECTADPFMPHLDAYLTWIWIKNDQVPAFPAVYSDKVIMFGTDFRGLGNMDYGLFGVLDEVGVRIFSAQSFLFGRHILQVLAQGGKVVFPLFQFGIGTFQLQLGIGNPLLVPRAQEEEEEQTRENDECQQAPSI